jgi:hypothetical protein
MTLLTADELLDFLAGHGICAALDDNEYCLPSRASFYEQALAAKRNMDRLGLMYREGAFDCEDFADLARALMRISHDRTPGAPAAGLAVGVFSYISEATGGSHAIVFAVVKEETGLFLAFAEPQTGEPLNLSAEEIASSIKAWV